MTARLGAPRAAIDDLERYLRLASRASDAAEVRRLLERLERSTLQAPNQTDDAPLPSRRGRV